MFAKVDSEAPHQYVGEGVVDDPKVGGEASCRCAGVGTQFMALM